jgi:NAD(P)-dependent dehydrogenase (short-subunit alcohol dehydrogenase family)
MHRIVKIALFRGDEMEEEGMLDSNRLDGKVAVITGAGGEIGIATARLMAARGARIVGVDRDPKSLDRLSSEIGPGAALLTVEADVADEASVEAYVARAREAFGGIDVFFNNAGIEGRVARITNYPVDEFRRVLEVNVVGVMLGMKHVIPAMAEKGGGSIVNTSSVAGLTGTPGICAYNASKHAVIGLTRSAAAEWASRNIRVNAVNPGPIESRMMRSLEEGLSPDDVESIRARLLSMVPAGRYGLAEEVATLVAFLASDDARYLNGGVYTVDGAFTAT